MRINQLSPVNTGYGMDSPQVATIAAQANPEVQATVKNDSSENSVSGMENVREEAKEFDSKMLDKSVAQANKSLKSKNRVIERAVHEVTKTVMYTVKDTSTNEVIAEFPPKRIQDMVAKMWELAGLFVDEEA